MKIRYGGIYLYNETSIITLFCERHLDHYPNLSLRRVKRFPQPFQGFRNYFYSIAIPGRLPPTPLIS